MRPSQSTHDRTFRDRSREDEGVVILVNELPIVLKPAFAQSDALRDELRYVLSCYLEYDASEPVNVAVLSNTDRRFTRIIASYNREFFEEQEATMQAKKVSNMRHDLLLAIKLMLPGFRLRRSLLIGGIMCCVLLVLAAFLWVFKGLPLNPLLIISGLGSLGTFLLHWGLYEPLRIYGNPA